jgi:hypothetical protein
MLSIEDFKLWQVKCFVMFRIQLLWHLVFHKNSLVRSCPSFEYLSAQKIPWSHADWCKRHPPHRLERPPVLIGWSYWIKNACRRGYIQRLRNIAAKKRGTAIKQEIVKDFFNESLKKTVYNNNLWTPNGPSVLSEVHIASDNRDCTVLANQDELGEGNDIFCLRNIAFILVEFFNMP